MNTQPVLTGFPGWICWILLACITSATPGFTAAVATRPIDFNRDIRPILSENCFQCHGSDAAKRKGKLRLDVLEGEAAGRAIVPGQPDSSEVVKRIFSQDPDELMPPAASHRKLEPGQKQLLKDWIAAGGKYEGHWAFRPISRPGLPGRKVNGIDHLISARLAADGLRLSPQAPIDKLLRRVSLDLTGLPPSPDQIKTWKRSGDPYSAAVEDLLQSPHFGERLASDWMDVARYADTHGFNNDSARTMWRWRDWVIDAFNQNLPYDRFIRDQLAGDLLPNPSLTQQIATGFNRNHVINSEGGIIDEEYRVEYVADRVQTISVAWLGLTTGCARCHDHKYDPITMKDYYGLYAFFNNVEEHGEAGRVGNAAPLLSAPTPDQQTAMQSLRTSLDRDFAKLDAMIERQDWSKVEFKSSNAGVVMPNLPASTNVVLLLQAPDGSGTPVTVTNLADKKAFSRRGSIETTPGPLNSPAFRFHGDGGLFREKFPAFDAGKGWALSTWIRPKTPAAGVIVSSMEFHEPASSGSHGKGVELRMIQGGVLELRIVRRWPAYSIRVQSKESLPVGEWSSLMVFADRSSKAAGVRLFINGEECSTVVLTDDLGGGIGGAGNFFVGTSAAAKPESFQGDLADLRITLNNDNSAIATAVSLAAANLFEQAAMTGPVRRSTGETRRLRRSWLEQNSREAASLLSNIASNRAALLKLEREAPSMMVMQEMPMPRPTFMLNRGQFDQPRAAVLPGVPAFLPPLKPGLPPNRLGLASWLADPQNPLTARVVVNRFWQNLFGIGLVKSAEDFGFQADYPSHPELLDWLASEFIDSGWNVKHLFRLMVSSATYRQRSDSTAALNERDPENRLLARGPRNRLTAEMLRDQALTLSGLLNRNLGGPSVFPYQPTNLYKGIVVAADYPGTSYVESKGADLHRRSLYTFWKRTVPHPSLATFDSPDREVCVARRLKTNTPLQALALMNDPIQLECARKFAERLFHQGGNNVQARMGYAFELATGRRPKRDELRVLRTLLEARMAHYQAHPDEARAFLSVGTAHVDSTIPTVELAAYSAVAGLILNLDETITRN